MNRQIKFRAWDKDEKKMLYPEFPTTIQIDGDYCGFTNGLIDNGVFMGFEELMQFTGLTDKNGKDIYEGDFLSYKDKHSIADSGLYVVGFDLGGFTFGEWQANEFYSYAKMHRYKLDIEVVGNIYQKPELLKLIQ